MSVASCSTSRTRRRSLPDGRASTPTSPGTGPIQLDGVLVEKMGAAGIELIVGARQDPAWGVVVLAGFGGVQAEILKDVRLFSPDMTREDIVRELLRLKSAALLRGFRGSPPMDVGAVAGLIERLGRWLEAQPAVREIDLNPVMVYPQGGGAVALDALMQVGASPAAADS